MNKYNVIELTKAELIIRAKSLNYGIGFNNWTPQDIRVWLVENYPTEYYYGIQSVGSIAGHHKNRGAYVNGSNQSKTGSYVQSRQFYTDIDDEQDSYENDEYEKDFIDDDILYEDDNDILYEDDEDLDE